MTSHRRLVPFAALAVACSASGGPSGGPDASAGETGSGDAGADAGGGDVGDAARPMDAGGAAGDPCTNTEECQDGLACAGGTCTAADGECTTDADCDGDTYCCAAGCVPDGDPGRCIPYGSGPRGDTSPECVGAIQIGLFEPDIQCEWDAPPAGDPFPDHVQVLTTPLVADLANDSGVSAEIVIVSYNFTDGGGASGFGTDSRYFGVIRVLDGQGCRQVESIADPDHPIIAASPPAIGDLDGDGQPEIVTHRAGGGVIAFRWNDTAGGHERYWVESDAGVPGDRRWDGPSIHDLDDDGFPEVISGSAVFDGRTGARLNEGQIVAGAQGIGSGVIQVLADVEGDGAVELLAGAVHRWNAEADRWEMAYPGIAAAQQYAVADFGTPGATPEDFDASAFDGIAEVVTTGEGTVRIGTLGGQVVLEAPIPEGGAGGPPNIGDFDNDGRPEIATAGATRYAVFDLDCVNAATPGCEAAFRRWSQPSQDESSNRTGSSIFDFEGDGQAEAVYADECFARIYDGATGAVLYSAFRTSCTWYENPVIADPDRDENTEILIGSNTNCNVTCPAIDPIHPGVRCQGPEDCASEQCVEGLCRCAGDEECPDDNSCTTPPDGTPGTGNTCRAAHPPDAGLTGLRVLRDTLDRWVSSRPMWNQHAYSVTNVDDDGTIPRTSAWARNHADPSLNNYRQNVQGARGAEDFPDITGRLAEETACRMEGERTDLVSTVCNRGNRAVGAALPATFYLGDPADDEVLCVSYTDGPVPVGGCLEVSCELTESVMNGEVTVVVNDDGEGGQTTVECESGNNTHTINLDECLVLL